MMDDFFKDRFLRRGASALALAMGTSFAFAAPPLPRQDMQNRHALNDRTEHPLAGTEVLIELEVIDNLGHPGRSRQYRIRLPQREFRNPANAMMAGLRVLLAKDANMAVPVAGGLERVMIVHKTQIRDPKIYHGLKNLQSTLVDKKSDPAALNQAVSTMWDLMMQMEEDILSRAEKALRELEQKLREALEKNKSMKELMDLMQKSNQAMQDVLKERADQTTDPQERQDLEDMQKMLEEMKNNLEEMMKMDPNLIQKMLEQMQKLMQMQKGQQNSQQQQQKRQNLKQGLESMQQRMQQMHSLQQQLREIDQIIKEQEALKEQTDAEQARRLQELKEILDELKKFSNELGNDIQEYIRSGVTGFNPAQGIRVAFDGYTDLSMPENSEKPINIEDIQKRHKEKDTEIDQHIQKPEDAQEWQINSLIDELGKIQDDLKKLKGPEKEEDPSQGGKKDQGSQDKIKNLQEQRKQKDQTGNLQKRQEELKKKLEKLMKKRQQQKGGDPGKLKDATDRMKDANDKLNQKKPGEAVPNQDKALDALKKEQQQMMQELMQIMMQSGMAPSPFGSGVGPSVKGTERSGDKDYIPDPLGVSSNMQGVNPKAGVNDTRSLRDMVRDGIGRAQSESERRYLEKLHRKLSP